ncbi:MAG TPA: TIGR03016 family PEP-CTERM system-associated outer membrane protein [Oleiagrimonas sp.]|nr:TIGR03016 family PEP-CTERM system-associated outer membrane protein [Oleiagrimonas sp.]
MRTLSAPVVLSSVILAGWLSQAPAQDVQPGLQSGQTPAASTRAEHLPPGVIRTPTVADPGTVVGVKLGELYTDNLHLDSESQATQGSWVTTIEPFVMTAYSGPRFSGVLNYTLSGYVYAGSESHTQVSHDLDADGTLVVVPRHLFLAGTATYQRAVINHRRPSGSGAYFLDNNRANVGTATLSPYWVQDLGAVGTMMLRYTRGRVVYNRDGIQDAHGNLLSGVSDISSDAVNFSIISPRNDKWGWRLVYVGQRLKPDHGEDLKFATATVGVSRRLGIHLRLLANVGRENRYLPDGSVDEMGADFWNVGLDWSNARNKFKVLAGHRFYGRSVQLSWNHHAALVNTRVSYEERPTDLNQQLLGRNPGATTQVRLPSSSIPSLLDRRIYLMKRATVSASLEMRTGRLSATLYDESRDYFRGNQGTEKVANAHLSWLFELGPFTTLTPTFGWQRYRFLDGQVNYTRYIELAAVHQIDPDNFVSLQLRHGSRDAFAGVRGMPGTHDYRVNVIYLQWTHLFGGI